MTTPISFQRPDNDDDDPEMLEFQDNLDYAPDPAYDEDEPDADSQGVPLTAKELQKAKEAEAVWKARVGLTGPAARERKRRQQLKLVEGSGLGKPPTPDETSYAELQQRQQDVQEKLARRKRRGR